ncbi:hypothetical protein EV360DRAFT_87042 [Lentinula raphanica]|nr:hypothetical protein EV360DRAFT_87042 [Lentinula raphanica]
MYPRTSLNLAKTATLLIFLFGHVRALPMDLDPLEGMHMQGHPRGPLVNIEGTPRRVPLEWTVHPEPITIELGRPRHIGLEPDAEQLPNDKTFIIEWAPVPPRPGRENEPLVISNPAVVPTDATDKASILRELTYINEDYLDHQGLSVPGGSRVKVIYNHHTCSFKDAHSSPGRSPYLRVLYANIHAKQDGVATRTVFVVNLAPKKPVFHQIILDHHVDGVWVQVKMMIQPKDGELTSIPLPPYSPPSLPPFYTPGNPPSYPDS